MVLGMEMEMGKRRSPILRLLLAFPSSPPLLEEPPHDPPSLRPFTPQTHVFSASVSVLAESLSHCPGELLQAS